MPLGLELLCFLCACSVSFSSFDNDPGSPQTETCQDIAQTTEDLRVEICSRVVWTSKLESNRFRDCCQRSSQPWQIILEGQASQVSGSTTESHERAKSDGSCFKPATSTHNGPIVCKLSVIKTAVKQSSQSYDPENTKDCATDYGKKDGHTKRRSWNPNSQAAHPTE